MIKAEDLRIGDLVKVGCNSMFPEGAICVVTEIDSETASRDQKGFVSLNFPDDNDDGPCGVWCCNIEGIRLTPEILEKNGFEVKRIGECYAKTIGPQKKYISRYISIERMHTEWKIFIKYTSLIDHGLLRSVNYVHELQHILWALGEDANIKI